MGRGERDLRVQKVLNALELPARSRPVHRVTVAIAVELVRLGAVLEKVLDLLVLPRARWREGGVWEVWEARRDMGRSGEIARTWPRAHWSERAFKPSETFLGSLCWRCFRAPTPVRPAGRHDMTEERIVEAKLDIVEERDDGAGFFSVAGSSFAIAADIAPASRSTS